MLERAACRGMAVIMIFVIMPLTVFSMVSTTYISYNETVYYVSDKAYVHFLMISALIAIMYLIRTKTRKMRLSRSTLLAAGVLVCTFLLIFVFSSEFRPRFDQRHVLQVAMQMLHGDYSEFREGGYAQIYPYQNGLLLFYELLLMILGPYSVTGIQCINLFMMVAAMTALYLTYKLLYDKYIYDTFASMMFIPFWGFVTLIYGNIPGFAFGVWALYFTIKYIYDRKAAYIPAAALCMTVSRVLKMNFIILFIALFIMLFIEAVNEREFRYIMLGVIMAFVMFAGNRCTDAAISAQTGMKVTEGIPGITYIAMGLHEHPERGAGWHDNYPENTYKVDADNVEKTEADARADIADSMRNFRQYPRYMCGFFVRKVASMWNEPSYDSLSMQMERDSDAHIAPWVSALVNKGKPNDILYEIMNILETLILCGTLIYFILNFNSDDFKKYIFALFFFGGFLCHMFWEASSQYAIFYVMLLTPYAAEGYIGVTGVLQQMERKKKIILISSLAFAAAVLSMPAVVDFLTLDRGNTAYTVYMSASR